MEKKLWSDYYHSIKPYCDTCLQQGIRGEEYAFCSTQKKPVPVYWEDSWGRNRKLIHTFNELYECNVYHWTIYQNQNQIK